MIIETKQEKATIIGGTVKNFGVNVDPSVYIQMLTKWYAKPESSIVRELLSNAKDACVEAGSEQQPVIGLMDDKFFVQDFGYGMSPDFMNNNIDQVYVDDYGNEITTKVGYLTIGHSTKKESNDMLGYFGVGRNRS